MKDNNLVLERIVYYFEGEFDKEINLMPTTGFMNKNQVQIFLKHKGYMKLVCMLLRAT